MIFLLSFPAYSQEEEEKKHYVISAVELLAWNAVLHCFNRFVTPDKNYGHVDWSDINHNLRSRWVWDQDEFNINQIGHSYQGASYFTAARAANLDFWEAAAYTTVFGNIPNPASREQRMNILTQITSYLFSASIKYADIPCYSYVLVI